MTDEDKNVVAEYMGWRWRTSVAHVMGTHTDFVVTIVDDGFRNIHFGLNDAGLCVEEMQKRGDWIKCYDLLLETYNDSINHHTPLIRSEHFIAWLFNAENFFGAMAAWLKEEKK